MHRSTCLTFARLISVALGASSTCVIAQPSSIPIGDWARETIELPPGFAPEMPSGVEDLRFAPGWRDPDSDRFWSYAMVLQIERPAPGTEQLEELFDTYYTGLMGAFGVGGTPDSLPNDVVVRLERTAEDEHRGTMRLVDGFATFRPITINIRTKTHVSSDAASIVEFLASPRPGGDRIWTELQAAVDDINAERLTPLAKLAHLPQGEWRTTPANGYQQRDVWTWGPSKRSLTSITTNSEATSESIFGSFRFIYHHPQRDRLAVLALSAPELIQIGSLTPLEGIDLRFDMTLFYDQERVRWASEPTRTISSVWAFGTPTSYINRWVRDQGRPVDPAMTGWSYRLHRDITALPASASEPPEEVGRLGGILPFVETVWDTDGTRTEFTWIPYNEAVLVRTLDRRTAELVAEMIIYPHPHTNAIHIITVHQSGEVDEGIAEFKDEAILIRAERADRDTATSIEQSIERFGDDAVRMRTWSGEGVERALLSDTTHRARPG